MPPLIKSLKVLLAVLFVGTALGQSAVLRTTEPDLTKDPTLYVVAYAHLDTQWRWQYPQVINSVETNSSPFGACS